MHFKMQFALLTFAWEGKEGMHDCRGLLGELLVAEGAATQAYCLSSPKAGMR